MMLWLDGDALPMQTSAFTPANKWATDRKVRWEGRWYRLWRTPRSSTEFYITVEGEKCRVTITDHRCSESGLLKL